MGSPDQDIVEMLDGRTNETIYISLQIYTSLI